MFRVVSKNTIEENKKMISDLSNDLMDRTEEVAAYESKFIPLQKENYSLREEVEYLRSEVKNWKEEAKHFENLSIEGKNNEVVLRISDDLMTITPIVRQKQGVTTKLLELGYLNDANAENPVAAQLALITIASEAVEQLIEQFAQPMEG